VVVVAVVVAVVKIAGSAVDELDVESVASIAVCQQADVDSLKMDTVNKKYHQINK